MKKILVGLIILAAIILIAFFVLGYLSKNGQSAGLLDGQLQPCPDSPNCVYSESKVSVAHYIDPLVYSDPLIYNDNKETLLPKLKQAINDLGGKIITVEDNYISATFSSKIFSFTDDLELRIEKSNQQLLLHFRASSRVGRSDFGVNRKRVETLKAML